MSAAAFERLEPPTRGEVIQIRDGRVVPPDRPIVPFIEGDGIGPDIMRAARLVLDEAVRLAYGGRREIVWFEVYAGEKAQALYGELLPQDTLEAIRTYRVALKGPLTTPVGGGFRSLNVTLRQIFDLYACIRPVRYFRGVPSPVRHPEKVDMVVFRENTEDVYAGLEWAAGSEGAVRLRAWLKEALGVEVRADAGMGLKVMSAYGSKRLVRAALRYAVERGRRSVTLVHKGNIMKWTEGAFREWGYEVAREEFGGVVVMEAEVGEVYGGVVPAGKVVVKDRLADNMFQQVLLRPEEYDVLATPNLNGDYLSDALAAMVGGLGMAPGANVGDEVAVFEATHGSAPKYAGLDKVNPTSLILSGVMMLEWLGWGEAARRVVQGLEATFEERYVTYDLARQMEGAVEVRTSQFAERVVRNMGG